MKPYDLIGCGAMNLDLIYRLPDGFDFWAQLPPEGSEDALAPELRAQLETALEAVQPQRSGGGQACNTVYAMAQMGFRSAMMGRVGDDEEAAYLLSELAPADSRFVARSGETGRVYVLLDPSGERRNLVWPAANDEFAPADLPKRLPHTRYAYFSSFVGEAPLEAQLALVERLPDAVELAFDPGENYARKGVKRFLPFLSRCSYLFATERELTMMCGIPLDEAITFLLNAGVDLIVCKMGGRGARLIGRRVDMYVAAMPADVVDVTGAGDLFAAGFLGGLIEGVGLEAAGRLAAWAASRGIAGVGRSAYPDGAAWRQRVAEERGEA